MIRFWKKPVENKPLPVKPPQPAARPESPADAAAARKRSDTDGTQRRERRTVESNRLL
jgi:hypothetical protein